MAERKNPLREKPLTRNIRPEGQPPMNLREYEAAGGYQALRKALALSPGDIIDLVKASNLRGRGGGGFAAGLKWSLVPTGEDVPRPKYMVANGDEMEPATFKDRILLEGDPHQFIEGMILSSYAIGAEVAFVFLRDEYRLSAARLQTAISEAYKAGYLGKDVRGSGYRLELYVHTSAGRYICGEETALLNALEGKRANPRAKPPYPAAAGLFGKPTVVNNIETICNVPGIVAHGPDWFKQLSYSDEGGTKIYGVSGRVKRPGAWELPMGTPMREILEEYAGGMREGYNLRAVIPGGASTEFVGPEHFDVAMDFASVAKVGSRLGTGTMVAIDDKTCPVALLLNLEKFFAQESCGWCTPCRDGLPWVAKILDAIDSGHGQMDDLETLERHCGFMAPGYTFCALAPGAAEPLQSGLKLFREDFERHIREKRCPYKT